MERVPHGRTPHGRAPHRHVPHRRTSHSVYLMGVYFTGVHLMGVLPLRMNAQHNTGYVFDLTLWLYGIWPLAHLLSTSYYAYLAFSTSVAWL